MIKKHYLSAVPEQKPSTRMSKAEAEVLIANMAKASSQLFKQVVLLVQYEGYRALGFAKPQPCLRQKLPELSNAYICRLLQAATLYGQLDRKFSHLSQVAEGTFRPLQHLDIKDSRKVWAHVVQQRPQQKITAQHVKTVIAALQIDLKTTVKPKPLTVDKAWQRDIAFHARRMSRHCLKPHVNNQTEWVQAAQLIYQQLLTSSPFLKTKAQTGE